MANRCLNKASLIGNLTRDPELRYTPGGVAVCSFGIATNRRWTTKDGEKRDEAQFHRVVAWGQLAEICSQLLSKGSRAYIEGRIQYREWTGSDEVKRQTTEIVIEDMILLDSYQAGRGDMGEMSIAQSTPGTEVEDQSANEVVPEPAVVDDNSEGKGKKKSTEKTAAATDEKKKDSKEESKDIPF